MSLKIERITNDIQTYTIPAAGDTYVEVFLPDWDCQKRTDLERIDEKLQEQGINAFQTEGIRLILAHYNPDELDAINNLVTRQLMAIGNDWVKSDQSNLLGEGDDKGEGSSNSSDSSEKNQS